MHATHAAAPRRARERVCFTAGRRPVRALASARAAQPRSVAEAGCCCASRSRAAAAAACEAVLTGQSWRRPAAWPWWTNVWDERVVCAGLHTEPRWPPVAEFVGQQLRRSKQGRCVTRRQPSNCCSAGLETRHTYFLQAAGVRFSRGPKGRGASGRQPALEPGSARQAQRNRVRLKHDKHIHGVTRKARARATPAVALRQLAPHASLQAARAWHCTHQVNSGLVTASSCRSAAHTRQVAGCRANCEQKANAARLAGNRY